MRNGYQPKADDSAPPALPTTGSGVKSPDWKKVYEGCAHTSAESDQDLLLVSREGLRLAMSALKQVCEQDYYHNYGAAWREIDTALAASVSAPERYAALVLEMRDHIPQSIYGTQAARSVLALAARAIRRGRHLTATEKLANLRAALADGESSCT